MITGLLTKVFGSQNERELKKLQPIIENINAFEPQIQALSDEQLKAQTVLFRQRLEKGESLDDILPEAFATVREASVRTLKMRHFDVQLIGGVVLHNGKIAEMKTGEGKTLAATLPAYLNALSGRGVHIITWPGVIQSGWEIYIIFWVFQWEAFCTALMIKSARQHTVPILHTEQIMNSDLITCGII